MNHSLYTYFSSVTACEPINLTEDYGTIRSPNYPQKYLPSTEICWIISVKMEQVRLKSNIFQLSSQSFRLRRLSNFDNTLKIATGVLVQSIWGQNGLNPPQIATKIKFALCCREFCEDLKKQTFTKINRVEHFRITVGELRSGVTGFATIFATGSHRFMLQVRNDERVEFNLRQKKGSIWPITGSYVLSFLPKIP